MGTARRTIQHASTKTYTHAEGLSCCFRQWNARSHCHFLHGYAIQVEVEFRAKFLDENNWSVDFGNLKDFKQWLKDNFDHKLLVAEDDPLFDHLVHLSTLGLADVRVVKKIGMEAFAEEIYDYIQNWALLTYGGRIEVYKVQVREHPGNSAIAYNEKLVTHV